MCSFACYPKKFHHKLRFYYIDFLCYLQTGCALSIKFYQAHRLWFFHFLCCWQMRAFMQHIWHISGARQTLRNKYQVTKLAHRCHLYTKIKDTCLLLHFLYSGDIFVLTCHIIHHKYFCFGMIQAKPLSMTNHTVELKKSRCFTLVMYNTEFYLTSTRWQYLYSTRC